MDVVHFAETHGHDQDRVRAERLALPRLPHPIVQRRQALRPVRRGAGRRRRALPGRPAGDRRAGLPRRRPVGRELAARHPRGHASTSRSAQYLDRDDMVTTVMSTFVSTDRPLRPLPRPQVRPDLAGGVLRPAGRLRRRRPGRPPLRPRPGSRIARAATLTEQRSRRSRNEPLEPALACDPPSHARRSAAWERSRQRAGPVWDVLGRDTVESADGATPRSPARRLGRARRRRGRTRTPTRVVGPDRLDGHHGGPAGSAAPTTRLPHNGPGRQDNGNLHLTEFRVSGRGSRQPAASRGPCAFAAARADFDQDGWTIAAMAIDGNAGHGLGHLSRRSASRTRRSSSWTDR